MAADIIAERGAAIAALDWQRDCGVDEVISDAPIDRFAIEPPAPAPLPDGPAAGLPYASDPVEAARNAAARARNLDELRAVIHSFDPCDLRKGARNTVFADGNPAARVLILGEAPGREEDLTGRPFVGRAGQLLDRMFAAIGLSRRSTDPETALYITNVISWRPPGNRNPSPEEIAMMTPFAERHIALVDPAFIVVMGNTPLLALTGQRGILRVRGNWSTALGRPLLPMVHPAYLLRNPSAKREAWADLLSLQARLGAA